MADSGKSLRALIKEAVDVRPNGVLIGVVEVESPLRIRVKSDSKLYLTESNLYIPRWMQKHTLTVTIEGSTGSGGGDSHRHGLGGTRKLTVDNRLRKDDEVYLLSFDKGALYYVLDLVKGDD